MMPLRIYAFSTFKLYWTFDKNKNLQRGSVSLVSPGAFAKNVLSCWRAQPLVCRSCPDRIVCCRFFPRPRCTGTRTPSLVSEAKASGPFSPAYLFPVLDVPASAAGSARCCTRPVNWKSNLKKIHRL